MLREINSAQRDADGARQRRIGSVAFSIRQIALDSGNLAQLAQQVGAALPGVRITFQLFDQPGRLRTVAASGGLDMDTEPAVFAGGVGIAGWVATEQSAVFLPDVTRDARFLPLRGSAEGGALLCVPLIDDLQCYGTLTARAHSPLRLARPIRGMFDFVARCAAVDLTKSRQMAMVDAVREVSKTSDPYANTTQIGSLMRELLQCRVSFIVTQETGQAAVRVFARESEDRDTVRLLEEWIVHLFNRLRTQEETPDPATYTAYGYKVHASHLLRGGQLIGLVCHCDTAPIAESVSSVLCALLVNTSLYQETSLRQSRAETERFAAFSSALPASLALLDGVGTTILEANPAFFDLIGVRDAERRLPLPVHTAGERWWPQDNPSPVRAPGVVYRWEIRPATSPDRTLAIVESPVSIGDGLYRIWTVHDITATIRAERTRSDFMSVVSHELRSPFTAIFGYLRILATETAGALTPMQREAVRVMDMSVRQLGRLIEDIGDLIQSDQDELALRPEAVDIIDAIRAAITSVMPLLQANDLRCELEVEAPLPIIQIDPVRFHQIATNLINNAMKFSEPGDVIVVRAYAAGGAVCVNVRDSGPGVAPEDRERIFERFVTAQDTARRDTSSLGLGLAVVRELVEKHGGRVWVENAPGGGSVFTFTLPITPDKRR